MKKMNWYSIHKAFVIAVAVGVTALFGVTAPSSAQDAPLAIGGSLVEGNVAMRSVDGTNVSLLDARGESGLVVIFWSNTCPWVERYEDRIIDLARDYRHRGFGFIVVNPNDPAAFPGDRFELMQEQAQAKRYPFPYVVDQSGRVARALGAARTPHVFVFDAENALVYRGGIDDSPADAARVQTPALKNALDAVSGGRRVQTSTTNAFGCTIKW